MALIPYNWNPTERQLRQFGLISLIAVPLMCWVFSGTPSLASLTEEPGKLLIGGGALGIVLGGLAWVRPRWLKPIFIGATLIAYPLGLVIGEVLMLSIYFLLFTPLALVFRVVGRDGLQRKINRDATTYWTEKKAPKDAESYFRQS